MAQQIIEFERFVATHLRSLLRTAYLIAWDEQEAEDLVQETLLRVARGWRRVGAMEHPFAYTRRVLVRLAVAEARGRRRRRDELSFGASLIDEGWPAASGVVVAAAVSTLEAPELLESRESRAELIAALGHLNPRQRAVIVLRYFFDLSEAETADAVGCSLGTVKSNASRGLARLRLVLERPGHAEPSAATDLPPIPGASSHE